MSSVPNMYNRMCFQYGINLVSLNLFLFIRLNIVSKNQILSTPDTSVQCEFSGLPLCMEQYKL